MLRERTRPGELEIANKHTQVGGRAWARIISLLVSTVRLRIVAQLAAWTLAIGIVVLSVVPPNFRPETGLPHGLEHFAIWWVTGVAFALAFDLKPFLLATALVIFSGAVELAQLFVPGRHARVTDFIMDSLACVVGLLMISIAVQVRASRGTR